MPINPPRLTCEQMEEWAHQNNVDLAAGILDDEPEPSGPMPPRGSWEWQMRVDAREVQEWRGNQRLIAAIRRRWDDLGPALLEMLAPDIGRIVRAILAEHQRPKGRRAKR
jgi:hypothetical protein